jgi:hypothetical protein
MGSLARRRLGRAPLVAGPAGDPEAFRESLRPLPARFLSHFISFWSWVLFRASNLAARDVLAQCISGTVSFANVTPAFLWVVIAAAAAHYFLEIGTTAA